MGPQWSRLYVTCVRRHGDHPPGSRSLEMMWVERTRNGNGSRKIENESCYLVFWSLRTLIGLKIWEKGLIV